MGPMRRTTRTYKQPDGIFWISRNWRSGLRYGAKLCEIPSHQKEAAAQVFKNADDFKPCRDVDSDGQHQAPICCHGGDFSLLTFC